LDDPSQVTLDFDDVNCSVMGEAVPCAATVIHLRRIERLNFPNLPATDTTLLTILTEQSLYQFRLTFPNAGTPSYFALEIQPNISLPGIAMTQIRIDDIQQIDQGLRVALSRGWITEGDRLWSRVQTFLALMRNGVPASDAASQAGISDTLVIRLNELGQSPTVLES
jgi:tRNA U55 pseudouridine synthase TruB